MRSKILTLGVLRKLVSSVSTLSMHNFFRWNWSIYPPWQASTWLLKYFIVYLLYLLLVARCTPRALQIYCWEFFRRYVARSKSGELSSDGYRPSNLLRFYFHFAISICVDRRCPFLDIRHVTARHFRYELRLYIKMIMYLRCTCAARELPRKFQFKIWSTRMAR